MRNSEIAFVDVETTGLNPEMHEIIEICIITGAQTYYTKIRPLRIEMADPFALSINGYNSKEWADAPTFEEVHLQISKMLAGKTITGHNVKFDIEFLNESFANIGSVFVTGYRALDTVTLAYEHLFPLGLNSLSLDRIRQFLNWDTKDAHTALKDCQDTKRLFLLLNRMGFVTKSKILIRRRFFKGGL